MLHFVSRQRASVFARSAHPSRSLVSRTQETGGAQVVQVTRHPEDSRVAVVTLSNAAKRNPLSLSALCQLRTALAQAVEERVRAVVLSSTGPVFSAGHDLKELAAASREHADDVFRTATILMLELEQAPVPVIAQVDGVVAAAGLQLVASCDMIVATARSTFSTPGIGVGVFCATPGVALARTGLPRNLVTQMLMTGEAIDAKTAALHGLVNVLSDDDDALQRDTWALLQQVLRHSGHVLHRGKLDYYEQRAQRDTKLAYDQSRTIMLANLADADGREGLAAFLEKRKPRYSW